MASTSTSGRNPQNEPVTSEEIAAASAPSFFTSCFQWFSSLFPLCPDRSRSTASTSTSARQPEDDLTDLAFEGIAPSLPSQAMKKQPYDIFINHRGPDVKYTLATSIYRVLNGMTLSVFLDSEELELGDCLPREIEEAMRKALLHIAIFSPKYAESPWCLAELSFMLKTGIPIVPVFYHVEPADLRWVEKGKGVYAPAFSRHEKKRRYTPEKLQEWKKALQDASFYNGNIVNNNDDEGRLLKNIVNHVLEVIKKVPLVVAKHPVGLHEAVNEFESITHQAARSHHDVQIVGIWGMGGSGKTTLAKELYNQKSPSMERSSFLFDVRDAASKSLLYNKQRQLLEDLGVKGVSFDNIEQGKGIIANRLRLVRLFLILDDVDHVDQLDALLPTMESVGSGSLIIVTTRESEVLRRWGISSIYKMRTLTLFHAEQLFCWHAFLQPSPPDEFEELVKMFLAVCKGLPLSLKVFGGQLYGISCKDYWKSQLHKLSRILPNDVKQSLKISYDALDNEEKEIFLDVACFFIGEEKSLAIEVWNGSGWSGLHSWETLINKCLVELDEKNRIKMHDHLRDLGREIASQHYPLRIWLPEQVTNVQNEAEIRGIMATSGSRGEIDGLCALAASWRGLKIFVVRGRRHVNQVLSVSTELVWLRCIQTGLRKLPSPLSLKKIRVLQLHDEDSKELWKDGGNAPVQLRELDMCDCTYLKRFPKSIGDLTNLKKLVVDNGKRMSSNLTSLPDEFCLLVSLEHLTLIFCDKLQELPARFGDLSNLRHLDLSRCSSLRMLPDSFKQLKFLHYLKFLGCKRLTLNLDMMENMTKLEYLNFERCQELEELPSHITNQGSLRELYLSYNYPWDTMRLKELPTDIGGLSKLRVMGIASNVLTRLPDSIGNLSSLTNLSIDHCPKLESLPESVGCLTLLEKLDIGRSKVQSLPHSIRQLSNLQTLTIAESPIRELDFGQGSFPSSLCNLKDIVLARTRASKISISEDCCPSLEKLQMCDNSHLTEITLVDLTSLKSFHLEGCDRVLKLEGLEECRSLVILRADTGWDAAGIQSLEHMDRLRTLQLKTNNISIVQPCTQTLKKWTAKTIICTARAGPDAGSKHLNTLAFPNLSIIDSFDKQERDPFWTLVQKRPPHADPFMAYFIINCVSGGLVIELNNDYDTYTVLKGEGKWIWVCVLTQCSHWHTEKVFQPKVFGEGYIEQGLLVTGEEKSLMEALPRLLSLLGR